MDAILSHVFFSISEESDEVAFMAKPNQVHTTYSHAAGNWRNVTPGASRPARVYDTKPAAQAAGRDQAMRNNAEHFIHNQNGQIAQRNSYGNDPERSKG